MPFSRHPLDYPFNRLLLRVGLHFQICLAGQPPIHDRAERHHFEQRVAAALELDQAVRDELIRDYRFCWDWSGRLRRIHLVPHPKVRRTPGIADLKRTFFPR
jgi:hypothetical protein